MNYRITNARCLTLIPEGDANPLGAIDQRPLAV